MIDNLLTALTKVKGGRGHWTACCPAHNDKRPSLAIRELDDGRILLKCFAGCSAHEIVESVGLTLNDLFPSDNLSYRVKPAKPERRAFLPSNLLRIARFEALIVMLVCRDITNGKNVSEADLERLETAFSRLSGIIGEIDDKYS